MISVGGQWYDEARVIRSAGYLSRNTSIYQEYVLAGMHEFEEVHEIDKYNEFIETIYMIMQPKSYKEYKKNKDLQRAEEGVDAVIYRGEDNWEEILEEFKAFGFGNIDPFGKGYKK